VKRELRAAPVVLLGAARSGTKLVRDSLALDTHIAKVPYDINYVWRFGNEDLDHDELDAASLTPAIVARIRGHLAGFTGDRRFLVEKTVSNCLRVPFVAGVLPDARYVHLVRDGRDVAESVVRQWHAKPDWAAVARKARAFPLLRAPGYATRYAAATFRRATGRVNGQTIWGPRYAGMVADLAAEDLLTVCSRQWTRCVELAMEGLATVEPERVHTVRFEEFVCDPGTALKQLGSFLEIDFTPATIDQVVNTVSPAYIGKGRSLFAGVGQPQAIAALTPGLDALGYDDRS
jgi:hypothetical protein